MPLYPLERRLGKEIHNTTSSVFCTGPHTYTGLMSRKIGFRYQTTMSDLRQDVDVVQATLPCTMIAEHRHTVFVYCTYPSFVTEMVCIQMLDQNSWYKLHRLCDDHCHRGPTPRQIAPFPAKSTCQYVRVLRYTAKLTKNERVDEASSRPFFDHVLKSCWAVHHLLDCSDAVELVQSVRHG